MELGKSMHRSKAYTADSDAKCWSGGRAVLNRKNPIGKREQ